MLVASLRDVIRQQSEEIEQLKKKLKEAASTSFNEVRRQLLQTYSSTNILLGFPASDSN